SVSPVLLSDERRLELAQAAGTAEVVGRAVVLEGVLRAGDRDAHAADRIGRVLGQHVLRARVPPRDELGEDRDRDLLLRRRTEVEPRGRADADARLLVETELVEDRGGAPRARDE